MTENSNKSTLLGLGIGAATLGVAAYYLYKKNSSNSDTTEQSEELLYSASGGGATTSDTGNTSIADIIGKIFDSLPTGNTTEVTPVTDLIGEEITIPKVTTGNTDTGNTDTGNTNTGNNTNSASNSETYAYKGGIKFNTSDSLGQSMYNSAKIVYTDSGAIDGDNSFIYGISAVDNSMLENAKYVSSLDEIGSVNSNNMSDEKADNVQNTASNTSYTDLENYYLNNYGITREDYLKLYDDYASTASTADHVVEHFGTMEQRFQNWLLSQKENASSSSDNWAVDSDYAKAFERGTQYLTEKYDTGTSSSWYDKVDDNGNTIEGASTKSSKNKYTYTGDAAKDTSSYNTGNTGNDTTKTTTDTKTTTETKSNDNTTTNNDTSKTETKTETKTNTSTFIGITPIKTISNIISKLFG